MSDKPEPVPKAPGQESVWDYPRPPRLEPTGKRIEIVFDGVTIADTNRAWRVLETGHPPVYYLPPGDVRQDYLIETERRSFCEWKGQAAWVTLWIGQRKVEAAAWYYPEPTKAFESIRNCLAFHAGPMDRCTVDGQLVTAQPGESYGGWITPDVVGPFKGGPGTESW